MEFPLWVSLVYFGTTAISLMLAAVLYRANPRRGINQAAAIFAVLCGVWQFTTSLIYLHPASAAFYIRVVMALHGYGVGAVALMLAALQQPGDRGRSLLRRTRWWWIGATVYAAPVFSPWFIPFESTAEHPLRGVLWVPYGVTQVGGGLLVVAMTLRAAWSLKGAARFTAQMICGACGLLLALLGLRFLLRPWLPPSGLPRSA